MNAYAEAVVNDGIDTDHTTVGDIGGGVFFVLAAIVAGGVIWYLKKRKG